MHAVVGCTDCGALWVVEDRLETTECRRCGRRHRYEKLTKFYRDDDEDAVREARAAMLADRAGESEAFGDLDSFATMGDRAEAGVVDDAEYLEGVGLDPDAVSSAGERATDAGGGSGGRRATVRAALRDLEEPTAEEVVTYAADRGVPEAYVREALEKLRLAGELTERDGRYRLL